MPEGCPSAAHLPACGTSLEAGVHSYEREEANLAVPQSSGQKSTSQPAPSPSGDFGANEWLVDEMYEQYKKDPKSVSPEWAKYFKTNGSGGGDQAEGGSGKAPAESPKSETKQPDAKKAESKPQKSVAKSESQDEDKAAVGR